MECRECGSELRVHPVTDSEGNTLEYLCEVCAADEGLLDWNEENYYIGREVR